MAKTPAVQVVIEEVVDDEFEEMQSQGSCKGNWSATAVECQGDENQPACIIAEDIEDTDGSVIPGCRTETLAKKVNQPKPKEKKVSKKLASSAKDEV